MKRFLLVGLLACWTPLVLANPRLDHNFWPTATPRAVEAAVRQGADLNARDQLSMTPQHWAAGFNTSPEVVRLLVELGAEVNARDQGGGTPLHRAATLNTTPAVIRLLVELGARLNARNPDGETPLHSAASFSESSEIVLALLELGADHRARTTASPRRYADAAGRPPGSLFRKTNPSAARQPIGGLASCAFNILHCARASCTTDQY